MRLDQMRRELGGIYVMLSTPFTRKLELDLEALKENVRFILDNGIDSKSGVLVPLAGMGEGPYLSSDEYFKVVGTVLDEAGSDILVFPGVHLDNTTEMIACCNRLRDMGVACVQLSPAQPYFAPTEEEVFNHYRLISEAVDDLGLLFYNTWWENLGDMSVKLVGRLAKLPNIVGAKWGCRDFTTWLTVVERYGDELAIFDDQGHDTVILGHAAGARGYVATTAQFAPWYDLKIWSLLQKRDYNGAWLELSRFARPLHGEIFAEMGREGKNGVSSLKGAAEVAGRKVGPPRPPQMRLNDDQKKRIGDLIAKSGVLVRPR